MGQTLYRVDMEKKTGHSSHRSLFKKASTIVKRAVLEMLVSVQVPRHVLSGHYPCAIHGKFCLLP